MNICLKDIFSRHKDEASVITIFEESVPVLEEIRNVVEIEDNDHPKAEGSKVSKDEPKKEEDPKEKIFVRPRFVKVRFSVITIDINCTLYNIFLQEELNITKKLLIVVLPESDWSEDLKMKKYYNMTLQPHLTEVTYLEKSSSGKTDILEVLKHIVS